MHIYLRCMFEVATVTSICLSLPHSGGVKVGRQSASLHSAHFRRLSRDCQNMVAVCFVYLALGMTGIALAQTPCNTSPHHRICAPEASCAQKGCACPEGSIGNPYLLCVPGNQAFCELVGDPHLKTFAGELSPVPIPCMYWATHFYVRKDSDVNKHCKVMVSVVNSPEPVGGQYFVIAAKVIVSMVTGADPSNPTSKTGQTVYYISSDAITKAKVNSKTSAWTLIGTAQSFVDTIYESVTNRAKLTIPSHNVTVTFTPIDTTQTVQTRLSGLVLATPNTTVWLNADFPNTLCSSIWAKDNIRERKREWNQTAGHVAVYGVLVQQLADPIPGDNNDGCEAAVTEFGECGTETKRMLAVQTCAPLVAKTSLASCLPSPAMEVVANCFKYQCHKDNYSACLELKAATAQCPEFKTYVSLNC